MYNLLSFATDTSILDCHKFTNSLNFTILFIYLNKYSILYTKGSNK